jgi:hypothetical protein
LRRLVVPLLIAGVMLAACASPEARRSRGHGPGGDVGNRPAIVKMHEGSEPYWDTPERIRVQHPPLDPARQADELSRP